MRLFLLRSLVTAIIITLLLGFGASAPGPVVAAGNTEPPLQGDVTCDDIVDTGDGLYVLRGVSLIEPFADCLSSAGDVDCSNRIDARDALAIFRFAAGLSAANPASVAGCSSVGETLVTPPGSEELIAAALLSGHITYEQSLLYRAYALYDHPDLPDEFRSPRIDYHAAIELFGEVLQNEGTLSAGLLNQLAPFRARPADPVSVFNNPPGQLNPASPQPWHSLPAANGQARVWVKDGPGWDYDLTTYAAEVTRVWNALGPAPGRPAIFRYGIPDTPGPANVNPDSAFDIYVVDVGTVDPRIAGCGALPPPPNCALTFAGAYTGYAAPYTDRTSASYVMLASGQSGPRLTFVLAHELMHAGQHAYDRYEPLWIKDATATWGGFRVLQELGETRKEVQDMLDVFFTELDKPLTRDPGYLSLTRYRAWLFFFFASMEKKSDGIITQIWQAAAAPGVQNEKAVNAVFPFDTYFDDFAVQNWNQDPIDPLYRSPPPGDPTFPTRLKPKLTKPNRLFETGGEHNLLKPVQNLASLYYSYTFGPGVRNVKFFNNYSGLPNAHVWAIKQLGGVWKEPEDWTEELVKEFCRDQPDEDLTGLILIVSNSHMKDALPVPDDPAYVKADTLGCKGWSGTVSMTFNLESSVEEWTILETAQTWARFELDEELNDVPGSPDKYWLPTEGAVNWRHTLTGECHGEFSGGFKIRRLDAGGNKLGSLSISDLGDKWEDGQPKLRYWAYGVTPTEDIPLTNFYDCDDPDAPPLPVFYIGFGSGGWLQTDPFPGDVSKDGKTLSGSYTRSAGAESSTRWQWHFTYHGD